MPTDPKMLPPDEERRIYVRKLIDEVRQLVDVVDSGQQLKALARAGGYLARIRTTVQQDPVSAAISPHTHDDATMQSVADVLQQVFDGLGFALLVFEFGEGGRMNYVGNALRDDICLAMREFITTHEGKPQ